MLKELGNVGEEANVRLGLAELALHFSQYGDAAHHLGRCLEIVSETGARPPALAAIALGADLVGDVAQTELPSPTELLAFVVQHSATWHHTRAKAKLMLESERLSSRDRGGEQEVEMLDIWSVAHSLRQALHLLSKSH